MWYFDAIAGMALYVGVMASHTKHVNISYAMGRFKSTMHVVSVHRELQLGPQRTNWLCFRRTTGSSASKTKLTHWGRPTPYGDKNISQHWFRLWLVAWRHQAITCTNADLRTVANSPDQFQWKSIRYMYQNMHLKIKFLQHFLHLPGANGLTGPDTWAIIESHSRRDSNDTRSHTNTKYQGRNR